jgi:hypothetical protein
MTIASTWKEYNDVTNRLSTALGMSDNIVTEYASYLIKEYINGSICLDTNENYDIAKDGKLYHVIARRLDDGAPASIGVIRSWNFDYLAVIIFSKHGDVISAYILPAATAKRIAVRNIQNNGDIITSNRNYSIYQSYKDITDEISHLNSGKDKIDYENITIINRYFTKLHNIQMLASMPWSNHYKIIAAYLRLYIEHDVLLSDLFRLCSDPIMEPELYVGEFNKNFNSMKNDDDTSYGKIFIEDGEYVLVYLQVMEEIKRFF